MKKREYTIVVRYVPKNRKNKAKSFTYHGRDKADCYKQAENYERYLESTDKRHLPMNVRYERFITDYAE